MAILRYPAGSTPFFIWSRVRSFSFYFLLSLLTNFCFLPPLALLGYIRAYLNFQRYNPQWALVFMTTQHPQVLLSKFWINPLSGPLLLLRPPILPQNIILANLPSSIWTTSSHFNQVLYHFCCVCPIPLTGPYIFLIILFSKTLTELPSFLKKVHVSSAYIITGLYSLNFVLLFSSLDLKSFS